MGKKIYWIFSIFVLLMLILLILPSNITGFSVLGPGEYDDFATCLAQDVKMYGAYWCPHCQDQKKMFGRSWKVFDKSGGYVECSLPNAAGTTIKCQSAGIKSYPTWEFSDGQRSSGTIALEQLSSISGCNLPD